MSDKNRWSKPRNPHLTRIKDLSDVKVNGITDGHMLVWDDVEKAWINIAPAGGIIDHYVSSGSYDNNTNDLTLNRTDGGDVVIDLSAISGSITDNYVDDVIWSEITRDLTIHRNDGMEWTVNIAGVTTDTYVESATWNALTRNLELIRNDATTIIVNIPSEDDYVISGVFNNITRILTLNRKDGNTINIGIPFADFNTFIENETPTGIINGVNQSFTLINSPFSGSVAIWKNGLKLHPGDDYTVAGSIISLFSPPLVGDKIKTKYIKS